ANSKPGPIALGPDGALWFWEAGSNKFARVATDGKFTEYPVPSVSAGNHFLTAGPDGAIWFTEPALNKIGRLALDGQVREFTIPGTGEGAKLPDGTAISSSWPNVVTVGPDKALWFTERWGHRIGRLTTDGTFSEFAVPTAK